MTAASARPKLTIVHELPGRIRLRLSHVLAEAERMKRVVSEHEGIASVGYTALSRSVLVKYDPAHVSAEEIVIRVAVSLSLEHSNAAVRVLAQPAHHALSDSAFYSGLSLVAALGLRLVGKGQSGGATMDWLASLGTTAAALEHGWSEYRDRGNFDPEVLSVTYLLASLLRGNALPAAIFTWLSTFGRHLVHLPAGGVEIRPVQVGDNDGDTPRYEVVVGRDQQTSDKMTFFSMIPNLLFNVLTGTPPQPRANMLNEIRRVSDMHGQVLEGVSDFRHGLPLRIR
jgi:copper chaperone CopZ